MKLACQWKRMRLGGMGDGSAARDKLSLPRFLDSDGYTKGARENG